MEAHQNNFKRMLEKGKQFEDEWARILIKYGKHVIPKYLYAKEGAPILVGEEESIIIPDLHAFENGEGVWWECKNKCLMLKHPATGYPEKHHKAYKRIQKITGDKVFVVFKDCSLKKVYGNWIDKLDKYIYRRMFFQGRWHILFKYSEAFIPFEEFPFVKNYKEWK